MTREEAKHFWPIIKAYSEGKTVQYLLSNDRWVDIVDDFVFNNSYERYRIKQEPKYRPFVTKEECWGEMLKHQPFGWIYDKADNSYKPLRSNISECTDFEDYFNRCNFADGTPFGIKED